MACDMCGKTGTPLVDLVNSYKTNEIAVICHDCERVVNKQLNKVRQVTSNILVDTMKRFMLNRKGNG